MRIGKNIVVHALFLVLAEHDPIKEEFYLMTKPTNNKKNCILFFNFTYLFTSHFFALKLSSFTFGCF